MQRDRNTDNTKNTKGSCEILNTKKARPKGRAYLVEIVGVEPTTPCLQSRCSSQLSYTPVSFLLADAASDFASSLLTTTRLLRRSSLASLAFNQNKLQLRFLRTCSPEQT